MEIEDLLDKTEHGERRVDMSKLVLYLARLNDRIRDIENSISNHMQREEEYQASVQELITLLTQTKGILRFTKTIVYVGGLLVTAAFFLKEHFKW